MATNKTNFIVAEQNLITDFLSVMERSRGLKAQYDALDLGSAIIDSDVSAAGLSGVTAIDFISAVGSMDTIYNLFDSGHDTNLFKIKP